MDTLTTAICGSVPRCHSLLLHHPIGPLRARSHACCRLVVQQEIGKHADVAHYLVESALKGKVVVIFAGVEPWLEGKQESLPMDALGG